MSILVKSSYKSIIKILAALTLILIVVSAQGVQQNLDKINSNKNTQTNIEVNVNNKQNPIPSIKLPNQSPLSNQLLYTQNIQQFKGKKYNQRLQVVVGCWLLSKQYLDLYKSDYLFFKDQNLKQIVTLKLVKQCMRRISRKDAVLKITQLVGKNLQKAKKYEEVIQKDIIDTIFIEVNKQNIQNYPQQSNEQQSSNQQTIINTVSVDLEQNLDQVSHQNNKSQQQIPQKNDNIIQNIIKQSSNSLSQFDKYLLELIEKYDSEFNKLNNSKEGLRAKVQEQLKKREKYYFGFIPATSFTHSVFLVTISLSLVFCCTCYKYYKMRSKQVNLKGMKQDDQNTHSHSHSHGKQYKKLAKMSQITMKRKIR